MPTIPLFCRWSLAPLIIAASAVAGFVAFRVMDWLDPVHDLDYWFYAIPYTGIGAATGRTAWYFARLTARASLSLAGAAPLLFTYVFIMSLALDKNPFVAAVATIAFGFILFLTWLANHARRNETATVPRSDQIPADG